MVDVEQILNLLDSNEQIADVANPIEANISKGEIEFKNVNFTYEALAKDDGEEKRQILTDISFTVPAGKSVGIVGQTGSGKSTIMRLLYRFYDITGGQILIDGQDIKEMKIADLRNNIAIVPQDCVLFNDTVMYNIAYGGIGNAKIAEIIDNHDRATELIDMIVPAAKRASIHDFIMEKSLGYWELVGERGLKLSGGEKQRVAIARALLKQTPIMCFDEATSALDTETERQVQSAI
jgi:ABC-type multidrug transport system fused ATPase/permease subunit